MTDPLCVTCEYIDPIHTIDMFARGYLAKRRNDCGGAVVHGDGCVTYMLDVNFPAWLQRVVHCPSFTFKETVRYDKAKSTCTVEAVCSEADATIKMCVEGHGQGTRVHCTVQVVPEFRGVPVPRFAVKAFIRNRFHQERMRDTTYARVMCAKRGHGSYDAAADAAAPGTTMPTP